MSYLFAIAASDISIEEALGNMIVGFGVVFFEGPGTYSDRNFIMTQPDSLP